jgi:tRNA threonylcarbamoyladenosine biosynthesis protein TsaB
VTLLAIETATDVCSVAIHAEGVVIADASLHRPRQHAAHLTPLIGALLDRCDLAPDAIDAVAVSAGPGSYTGLRIGVSTAKGLAMAASADLIGVPTFEALALEAVPFAKGGAIVTAFDARRASVYLAVYLATPEELEERISAAAVDLEEASALLSELSFPLTLVGDGAPLIADRLNAVEIEHVVLPDVRPSAVSVATLGARRWHRGERSDLASFEPEYLREFVAKTPERSAFEKLGF